MINIRKRDNLNSIDMRLPYRSTARYESLVIEAKIISVVLSLFMITAYGNNILALITSIVKNI